ADCGSVKTARGLKLTDSLEGVARLYGRPTEQFVASDNRLQFHFGRAFCYVTGFIRATGLMVMWRTKEQSIEMIQVGSSRENCGDPMLAFREPKATVTVSQQLRAMPPKEWGLPE